MLKHFPLALLLSVLGLQTPAAAADEFKNAKVQITSEPAVRAGRLHLDLSIKDSTGRPITKLERENIKVSYAGRPLALDSLMEVSRGGRAIILAIDFSGSMNHYAGNKTKLQSAKETVGAYFDTIVAPSDEVAVVAFDSLAHLVSDFTRDRKQLRQRLEQATRYPNGTALLEGIRFSLKRLRPRTGEKLLIVISDGMDTDLPRRLRNQLAQQGIAIVNEAQQIDPPVREERKKLIKEAGDSRVKIFTVGIGRRNAVGEAAVDTTFLQQLALATSGTYNYQDVTPLPLSLTVGVEADELGSGLLQIFRKIDRTSRAGAAGGEYHLVVPWAASENFDYKRMNIRLVKPLLERLSVNETLVVFLTPLLLLLIIPALAAISFDGVWFTMRWVKTAKPNFKINGDWDERPLLERVCSYCREHFQNGQKVVICPQCLTVHHMPCWSANDNHCAARVGCGGYGKPLV